MPVTDLGDDLEPVNGDPFADPSAPAGLGALGAQSDPGAAPGGPWEFRVQGPEFTAGQSQLGRTTPGMLGKGYPADFTKLYNSYLQEYVKRPDQIAQEHAQGGGPWTTRMQQLDNLKATYNYAQTKEGKFLRKMPLGAQDYIAGQPDFQEWQAQQPLHYDLSSPQTMQRPDIGEPGRETWREAPPERRDIDRLFGNQIWEGYLGTEQPFARDAYGFNPSGGWGLAAGGRVGYQDGGAPPEQPDDIPTQMLPPSRSPTPMLNERALGAQMIHPNDPTYPAGFAQVYNAGVQAQHNSDDPFGPVADQMLQLNTQRQIYERGLGHLPPDVAQSIMTQPSGVEGQMQPRIRPHADEPWGPPGRPEEPQIADIRRLFGSRWREQSKRPDTWGPAVREALKRQPFNPATTWANEADEFLLGGENIWTGGRIGSRTAEILAQMRKQ